MTVDFERGVFRRASQPTVGQFFIHLVILLKTNPNARFLLSILLLGGKECHILGNIAQPPSENSPGTEEGESKIKVRRQEEESRDFFNELNE